MSNANPFDILGEDDNDDPSHLITIQEQKAAAKKSAISASAASASAKFPSKPAPPSQAVKETRGSAPSSNRGGAFRGGPLRGRGGRSGVARQDRYSAANGDASGAAGGNDAAGVEELDAGKPSERGRGGYGAPRGSFRGGRRGGYRNGEADGDSERPPRRTYERHSGTGRGYEMKREGSGRGNWGTTKDDVLAQVTEENPNVDDATVITEKPPAEQEDGPLSEETKDKEGATNEAEEKEPEDKEMTLEEYEKVREEKRKALLALKSEERKVEVDKEFESMQQLSIKKGNDDIFVKLGADKDSGKKKDISEREERVKKSMNITEFLKPAKGERYYGPSSRGRGRGRGDRGSFRGDFSHSALTVAPAIQDPQHFPTLGVK